MQKNIVEGFRVSPQQERLWSLQQDVRSPHYRTQCAVMIEGKLDHDTLLKTLKQIVSRHEIFRTTFHCDNAADAPLQVINEDDELFFVEQDLRALSPEQQSARIELLFDEALREPLGAEQAPSLRACVLALSAQRCVLILTLPAMCADRMALENLVREISVSYDACLDGEDSTDETLQYADTAEWLNDLLESGETEAGREYWSQFELSRLHTLRLPFESTPPENFCFTPRSLSLPITTRIAAKVRELAGRLDLTADVILQACWQTLLWRLSGQSDFIVGTLFEHRKYEQLRESPGLFAKYLPIHARLDERLTFIELLSQVAESVRAAFTWQEYFTWPQATESEGVPSQPVFFPISFEYLQGGERYSSAGLTFHLTRHYFCLEPFTLKLSCTRRDETLDTEFHYDPARFSETDVRHVGQQFHTLLGSALDNMDAALSELEILSAEERAQLLHEFNDTAADYPRDTCLHQLFEAQAARTPGKIAAEYEDESITFDELNRRANQLAHHLREKGVGPEVLVAICLERSLEMLVGLLGILKAGGAYVPLDPAYPSQRLSYMLSDARVAVMLTEKKLVGQLPEHNAEVVSIDGDGEEIARGRTENSEVGVRSDNCAYVIYTSGSTGQPKGVQITHRAVVNFLISMQREPGLCDDDTLLAVTTLSFDIAALELYLPLITGARIHIAGREVVSDAERLRDLLSRSGATVMQATPVTWRMLAGVKGDSSAGSLKILCGGEALAGELAQQLVRRSRVAWNMYGPTESTIWSATYRLTGDERGAVMPVGRAIANTQIYVLDERLRLLPVGVPGELYIGGDGLARGYLGQSALTAERFVPDAFGTRAGQRLYKTGDLGSYSSDGNLEYLGRVDQQVKVRGTRIEPGEIEAVLLELAEVRAAVVVARPDMHDENRLIAYVVAEADHALAASVLRQKLAEHLPEYMIPTVYVELKELPLTQNGKVDRRALPAPDHSRPSLSDNYLPACTPAEEMLVSIWGQVLKVERVGIKDNFFELGGHSLLATQLMSRVREVFGVEAELRKLFEQPTIAALAVHLEELRSEGHLYSAQPIVRISRDEPLPLSFAQQRLWFINELEPHSSAYNIPAAVRLTGHLDVFALTRTFTTINSRHESLRTTFAMVDGHPVQVISPPHNVPLPLIDLYGLSDEHRQAETHRLVAEEAGQSFDLEHGPLLRARLLHLSASEHVVLLTLHHIISDGWSMGVLVREIATIYEAYAQDLPSPLTELPIQYADYAHWQRRWLQGDVLDSQLSFWRQLLSNSPPALDLPTDRPRPLIQTFRGAISPVNISSDVSEALKRLSHQEGVTLFMTLLAAFQLLLSRYSAQTDITIGSPIANRHHQATEPLIGFFVNTLALRTDLSGDPTFSQLLERVRETSLGAYAHQDVPFEMLVEELRPARDMSRNPFFQVMLVLQSADAAAIEPQGLRLEPIQVDNGVARFDLLLHLTDAGQQLGGALEYNTDLFDAATISRLLLLFNNLLSSILAHPLSPVSQLPLLSATERLHLLSDFNPAPTPFTPQLSLQLLFEQQVLRSPDATALVCSDQQLSFSELNERANRLAHLLRGAGAVPGSLIAICCDRSIETAIAVLAVIKAGAGYLPLDPSYPEPRLQFMLEDARPLLLITQEPLLARLPSTLPPIIRLDTDADSIAAQSCLNPPCTDTAEQLLYVIYTSGSTGVPKGVAVPQRVMSNLVQWHLSQMLTGVPMLQFASLSFDASIHEMMAGWVGGSALHIVSEEMRRDVAELARYIREQRIGKMILPVVVLQQLAEQWEREGTEQGAIREVTTTGEQMQLTRAVVEVMQRWEENQTESENRCALYNHYGPTETHVATSYRLNGAASEWSWRPPIGRPIANTALYILDERMQVVPQGVRGEIYLGGECVARGYLNRSPQTAERFVPDPFSDERGRRMYRTGDVGRYRTDGTVEYVGREDEQVKVRGYRVELGEVEAALSHVEGVRESVVVMEAAAGTGEGRLVAYVVREEGTEWRVSGVREELGRELPEYMIPSVIMELAELPLTQNGKVDRRALPAPDHSRPSLSDSYLPARTPAEEMLVSIWGQVLKVERVGIKDNFFELGGHSLLATQLMSRVREVFGVEAELRKLFEQPTIAALAVHIEQLDRSGRGLVMPSIKRVSRDEPLPLSFAQQRLWLLDQLEPGNTAYNIPAAVRLEGRLNVAALEQSFNAIIARHETLRTTFALIDEKPVQIIHDAAPLNLLMIDLSDLPMAERETLVGQLITEEARKPFDLAEGPLLRIRLLRLGIEEFVVSMTMHHIVSDGWSTGVLVHDLAVLYALCSGEPIATLPELGIQYADYAHWQRAWLQGDVLDSQLSFWRQLLSNSPPHLDLPTDRPRPPLQSFRGAHSSFSLSPSLGLALDSLSRLHHCTLFMTLLAAFQLLLSRYSAQVDITIGSPIANRHHQATEPLIGFFVNTLALRTDLSGNPTFSQLLERVRETSLGAYAHQDVPFEMLVEELRPTRDLSRTPLFQVVLTLQNAPTSALSFAGLELSSLAVENRTAKFDLVLNMSGGREGMRGSLEYNTDLFDAETIERLLMHFERLLEQVAEDGEKPLSQYSLMNGEERERLVEEVNQTADDSFPLHLPIHRLIEQQVTRTPHSAALFDAQASLTYEQLNARANQLSELLIGRGISTGSRVGLCLSHSFESIISILGVLKTGASYVPFDRQHPPPRLRFMIEDAALALVISTSSLRDRLPEDSDSLQVLCLDEAQSLLDVCSTHNPELELASTEEAYLIYTSGSTGVPKGVQITHRSLVNYISWAASLYLRGESLNFALYSSPAFDLTVTSIFTPLITGSSIIIFDDGEADTTLEQISRDERVGVLKLTPSHLALWSALLGSQSSTNNGSHSIKRLIVGGESLTTALARQAQLMLGPDVEIYNEYGPTETTVGCLIHQFDQERDLRVSVPIGVPIANTQLYLLDEWMQPVAEGVTAEIFIGGAGVGAGYLNRVELTRERFIQSPLRADQRLYRTGDRGRWLSNGEMEYLGRSDEQVKYHGYRVELEEIRCVVNRHRLVRDSVVELKADKRGEAVLVCYYVSRQAIESRELREHVSRELIRETVPALYVHMKRLPLTMNGKVNKEALAGVEELREAMEAGRAGGGAAAEREQSEVERGVGEIWREVLGIKEVGLEANFFELGGHSLLATAVVVRVRERWGVEMGLRRLFERPTVRGVGEWIEQEQLRRGEGRAEEAKIGLVGREQELPLSFAQQRLWFLDQLQPGTAAYNIPAAVRLQGELDLLALNRTFTEIIRRHEVLRTTFSAIDGRPRQVIHAPSGAVIPLLDLSDMPERERRGEVRRMAAVEALKAFDLEGGPLLRVKIVRESTEEHVVLVTMHHIISDGLSMGILVKEVAALYEAYRSGEESGLEELAIQYADFAAWQRQRLQGEVLERELDYWRRNLSGDLPVLELPTDRRRPARQTYVGRAAHFVVGPETSKALRQQCRREGATMFMTLLAAWQTLLHRYTGQDDIRVGTPIASRERPETEGLIGCLLNTLVMRADFSGRPNFKELLGQVKETALGAYAHQDAPFEMLVEELQPERQTNYTPLFQVWFVMENAGMMKPLRLPGLELSPVEMRNDTAQFDLALSMVDADERIGGKLIYNTDLFDDDSMVEMVERFQSLLEKVSADSEQRLLDIPLDGRNTEAGSRPQTMEQAEDQFML